MSLDLDQRERATVLAALRFWQRIGLQHTWANDSPKHGYRAGESTTPEGPISSDGGTLKPLNALDINALCERINQ